MSGSFTDAVKTLDFVSNPPLITDPAYLEEYMKYVGRINGGSEIPIINFYSNYLNGVNSSTLVKMGVCPKQANASSYIEVNITKDQFQVEMPRWLFRK